MIKVITGTKVASAQPLSPIDLIYKDIYSIIAFVYDYELQEDSIYDGLMRSLDINTYVGGRLSGALTKSPMIHGNNKGIVFSSCKYDSIIPEYSSENLIKSSDKAEKYLLECPADSLDENTPLVQIKLSNYINGSVLCVSFCHALCDASVFSFLRDWSRMCRNIAISSPENDRDLLSKIYEKYTTNNLIDNVKEPVFESCTSKMKKVGFGAFEVEGRYIDDTYEKLIHGSDNQEFFSRQDFVVAYILKNLFACIDLKEAEYSVGMIMDIRKLMGLPASYFGNAVASMDIIKRGEFFRDESLLSIAKYVRKTINNHDLDKAFGGLRATINNLKNNGDKDKDKEQAEDKFLDNKICINNYTKLPIYDVDFGEGAPVWAESLTAITVPGMTRGRSVIAWPSSSTDGGVVYHVILPMDELLKLKDRLPVKGSIGEFKNFKSP